MRKDGKIRFSLAIASMAALCLSAAPPSDWEAAGKAWWKNVEYLASDDLEGRNVGSPGYEKAASYVAAQFKTAGLTRGGSDGYFQQVGFVEVSVDPSRSHLALLRDGRTQPVAIPAEAQLGYSPQSVPAIEAPVVFAGYGLVIPEAHYDDLKGLPVKGAIVAYLSGGPANIDGNLRSHYSSAEERWKALRAAGAVGTVAIQNPKTMEIPWARQASTWGMPEISLADASLQALPLIWCKFIIRK